MPGPSRQSRVGEQIRVELAELIARQVQDPGIGFVTLTRASVTPDLQQAFAGNLVANYNHFNLLDEGSQEAPSEPRLEIYNPVFRALAKLFFSPTATIERYQADLRARLERQPSR